MAGSILCFPTQSKKLPRKSKPKEKTEPEPKSTVIEWIRSGHQFPGKPAPPLSNPEPHKPAEGGAR